MTIVDPAARGLHLGTGQRPAVRRGSTCPWRTRRPGESMGEALEVDAATLDEIIAEARSTYRTTWRRVPPDAARRDDVPLGRPHRAAP